MDSMLHNLTFVLFLHYYVFTRRVVYYNFDFEAYNLTVVGDGEVDTNFGWIWG